MDNGKLLGKRLEQAEASHRKAMSDMMECNNRFRALDRDLNTLRPDLMRLQWEKDQYTRYSVGPPGGVQFLVRGPLKSKTLKYLSYTN